MYGIWSGIAKLYRTIGENDMNEYTVAMTQIPTIRDR